MTRKAKDERLKLDRFPPLTPEQKAKLADAQFEQARRLRQGTYPADEAIAELKKGNNAHAIDPQLHQAHKLLERFKGDDLCRLMIHLEYFRVTDDLTNAAWSIRAWLADRGTNREDLPAYTALVDALLPMSFSPFPGPDLPERVALKELVSRITDVDKELGAAYYSRLCSDLYDQVKRDGLEKELEKFVECVQKSETAERAANLAMTYFNLAMRLGDRQAASTIAVNAPWRFAHEQIDAKYRMLKTNGQSGFSHVRERDEIKQSLRELRDKCLPHFLFTAACQVAEMTGEAEDFEFVKRQMEIHSEKAFCDKWTDEEVRLLARAFLASYNDPDHREGENEMKYNHDRMLMYWEDLVRVVYRCEKQQLVRDRLLTIFVVEASKRGVLSEIELWDFVVSDLYGRSIVLPSSVALVAEAAGAEGLPLLERAYARAQDETFGHKERITALCRIARLKKQFEEQSR